MNLAIFGAGGQGRETLRIARQIARWTRIFFIDDVTELKEIDGIAVQRFSEVCWEACEVIIALGEPAYREKIAGLLPFASFATLIHPGAIIDESAVIGVGTVVAKGAFISCDVVIGKNVLIQPDVCLSHDVRIGDNSVVSLKSALAGRCHVGKNVFLGMSCSVKEKTAIGDDAIVGMGAVVISDVSPATVVAGNPARFLHANVRRRVFSN